MISLGNDGLFRNFETTQKEFCKETDCLGSGNNENFKIAKYGFGNSFDFLIDIIGTCDEIDLLKIDAFKNYLKDNFQFDSLEKSNNVLHSEIEKVFKNKNNENKTLVYAWTNKD